MLKDRRAVVRLCEITHVEHAWSGGDPAVRYHSRGGPDASALIWRFFQAQRRGAAGPVAATGASGYCSRIGNGDVQAGRGPGWRGRR